MTPHRVGAALLATVALLASGCSSAPPAGSPAPQGDDLHAYISNQSFEQPTADILVTIDGLVLFDGKAEVEQQHNWMLREAALSPGQHRVEALERTTGTRASESLNLPAGEERWVVVNYWNPMRPETKPGFSITVHNEQVMFA